MQAVILAAGKSQRFYPYNVFGHKSMLSMMGKSLLQHTLEALKKAKFTSVILVVAKDSIIPDSIKEIPGLPITFVTQEETLGMGHALSLARNYLDETFFLLSGYHLDIADFAQDMKKKQKDSTQVVLLAKEDAILEKYGVLEVDGEKVTSITEKPQVTTGTALRAIAIYLLNKSFLQTLDETPVEHYHFEKALDSYAKAGKVVFLKADKPTITLKHTWDSLAVKDYLLSRVKRYISSKARVAKSAIVEGDVVVSDDVTILENACVKGPCFLGKGVTVGNNAILRNGVVVEEEAIVGANMEVKNSFLMRGVTTHTGYIGDSVIGLYSRIAAGFCSANVRFDRAQISAIVADKIVNTYRTHIGVVMGDHVDVGVNVVTMPGISIGNSVTIGPGTFVMENVEDNTLFYTKFQTTKKKKSIR